MGRSSYTQFIMEMRSSPQLKGLTVPERGRKVAEMYHSLTNAEKALLYKRAMAAEPFERRKVNPDIRLKGRRMGIPVKLIKEKWFQVKGSTVGVRLRRIAEEAGIPIRRIKLKR